ncbi:hypothetical protein CEXT_366341 [Caerostris extrusa]|uniref:Uncharacterized protein n=1 Tax=Caerostris extrusa TaxID=172846 RepID=A0AAV4RL37_CAEEX|nr:hypothetical protein CEXT_366341 [Caerostris extrusa]
MPIFVRQESTLLGSDNNGLAYSLQSSLGFSVVIPVVYWHRENKESYTTNLSLLKDTMIDEVENTVLAEILVTLNCTTSMEELCCEITSQDLRSLYQITCWCYRK